MDTPTGQCISGTGGLELGLQKSPGLSSKMRREKKSPLHCPLMLLARGYIMPELYTA